MSEHQSQEYRGNGNHEWETVYDTPRAITERLRVPGGWLYSVERYEGDTPVFMNTVFVALPEVVKHKV